MKIADPKTSKQTRGKHTRNAMLRVAHLKARDAAARSPS
jgi:hypothetical protein